MHNDRHILARTGRTVATIACLTGLILTAMFLANAWFGYTAHASAPPSNADCRVMWTQPDAPMADLCRDRGWHITGRLVVNPHGVVKHHSLPHCAYDEAQEAACTWNIGRPIDGNGVGLSFWSSHNRVHYVWPVNPVAANVGPPLHWVGTGLADALAEGQHHEANWSWCVTNGVRHHRITVACPDGWVQR